MKGCRQSMFGQSNLPSAYWVYVLMQRALDIKVVVLQARQQEVCHKKSIHIPTRMTTRANKQRFLKQIQAYGATVGRNNKILVLTIDKALELWILKWGGKNYGC